MWYVPLRVQHEKIANRKRGGDRRTEEEKKLKGEGVRKGGGGQETKKRRSGEREGMPTNQEKRERPVGDKEKKKKDERYSEILTAKIWTKERGNQRMQEKTNEWVKNGEWKRKGTNG